MPQLPGKYYLSDLPRLPPSPPQPTFPASWMIGPRPKTSLPAPTRRGGRSADADAVRAWAGDMSVVGRGPTTDIPFVKTKKRACVGISCGRLRLMRILKTRSDLIRAHLGDKRTVGAERFSTIESHQFQLAPITKIVPLGPVSQWDDSSQMGPSTKGSAIRVDLATIQATKTTSWLLREIRSSHE